MCKIGWLLNIREIFSCTCQLSLQLTPKLGCNRFSLIFGDGNSAFPSAMWHGWAGAEWVTSLQSLGKDRRCRNFSRGARVSTSLEWFWRRGLKGLEKAWRGEKKRRRKKKRRQRSSTAPFQYLCEEQQTLFGDLRVRQPQSLFQAADQGVDTWRTNQRISDSALHMIEQTNKTRIPSLAFVLPSSLTAI